MSTLLALAVASALAASPEASLLQHFGAQCGRLDSVNEMELRILASGWAKFQPPNDSVVGKQAKFYADLAAEAKLKIDTRVFEHSDQPAYAILISQVQDKEGAGSIECHVLNTSAARPNKSAIEGWAKRAPTSHSSDNKQMNWSWRPGLSPNASFTVVTFTKSAPKDSKMFPGVGLDAVAVRFFP